MFENPRRGRQARNFTTNVPKILDLKSSSEQIFSENCRWVPLHFVYVLLLDTSEMSYELSFTRQNRDDYLKVPWTSPVNILTATMWIKTSADTLLTLFTFGRTDVEMIQFNLQNRVYNNEGITAGAALFNSVGKRWR